MNSVLRILFAPCALSAAGLATLGFLLVPTSVCAQDPAATALANRLKPGNVIEVTDGNGDRQTGTFRGFDASAIKVFRDGREVTIPDARIRKVVHRDSLWNGIIIGAASGAFAGMLGAFQMQSGQCTYLGPGGDGCDTGAGVIVGGIALGLAGGAAIDALRKDTVFERAARNGKVQVEMRVNEPSVTLKFAVQFR